jgi:non-canonical purine NTP pyrophosphatase (RdgB/HAM1 family)
MRLVLASNNAKKLAELKVLFASLPLEIVAQGSLGVAEAEEPHHTFIENALAKARHAARATGGAAIADDSGLCVDALGGAPGVASAHFASAVLPAAEREAQRRVQDEANNALLLQRLQGQPDRRARFVSTLVAIRSADDPEPLVAVGRWQGEILAAPVDALIEPLATMLTGFAAREAIPQIEVAVADAAVALVFRVLSELPAADLDALRAFERAHGVSIYLQPGGLDTVRPLSPPAPRLSYALPRFDLELEFEPIDFIQVNGALNRELVARAVELLGCGAGDRVLDLFCGLGNFTLPIARTGASVVGVEGDPGLVARARANALRNGLAQAQFAVANLAQPESGATPWLGGPYTHVLLDPPRAGALEMLPAVAALAPSRIVYVSCHPGSLARDLGVLCTEHGYRLLGAGVVDMFPHTTPVESIALLDRPAGKARR